MATPYTHIRSSVCAICFEHLSGKDPIGSLNCGHCLHTGCYHQYMHFQRTRIHCTPACPICKTQLSSFTRLYLEVDLYTSEIVETSSSVSTPCEGQVHLCVEDAGTHYLNGTYRMAYEGTEIFYYRLGSLCNVESVEIRQQENEDDENCWYIMADYEGWPDNVRQYVAPVSDSSRFIPPSTGWSYVGTPDSVSVAQPPTIHHVID